ncbi:MAG: hypothetical protein HYU36_14385 [Planctomycetes bacterium]|nr:hypothetical protein [Planctomycetota bacterium]
MRPKVILDLNPWVYQHCVTPGNWERLEKVCEPVGRDRRDPYTDEEFCQAAREAHGLMKWGDRTPVLTPRLLEQLPALRIVGLWGDRFSKEIDFESARQRRITITDVSNIASSQPVAEWVLALVLACLRNAGEVFSRMIEGTEQWAVTLNAEFVNGELTGRKVGLVGCGHVGQRLIELLGPFHVQLRVCDPFLPEETVARLGIQRADLPHVIRHAEILVIQVPHTPSTKGMIGERELNLLRRGSILISCCRGPVIDHQALLRKLQKREIIAGLDVFDPEPLPKDSPLRKLPNVFLSPHIAWYAPDAFPRYFDMMVDEFERFFSGQPIHYELTPRMHTLRNNPA